MSMVNKWNYKGLGQVKYGHPESYQKACAWFDEIGGKLEDWGCGCAAAREFVKVCQYFGIEGSENVYADICGIDLEKYTSRTECLLMRDVIDHNLEWKKVLSNAIKSFTKRMVLVIFRRMGDETKVVFVNDSQKYPGVPDFQFCRDDLMEFIGPYLVKEEDVGGETMFYLEKK